MWKIRKCGINHFNAYPSTPSLIPSLPTAHPVIFEICPVSFRLGHAPRYPVPKNKKIEKSEKLWNWDVLTLPQLIRGSTTPRFATLYLIRSLVPFCSIAPPCHLGTTQWSTPYHPRHSHHTQLVDGFHLSAEPTPPHSTRSLLATSFQFATLNHPSSCSLRSLRLLPSAYIRLHTFTHFSYLLISRKNFRKLSLLFFGSINFFY